MSYRTIVKRSINEIEMAICLDYDDMQFISEVFPEIIKGLRTRFEGLQTTYVTKKTTEDQQDELKKTKYYLKLAEELLAKSRTELALNDDLPF